jgi:hypothetical protein
MIENWEKLDSRQLADYRIFTVRQDHGLSPRMGREHQFYVLEA